VVDFMARQLKSDREQAGFPQFRKSISVAK